MCQLPDKRVCLFIFQVIILLMTACTTPTEKSSITTQSDQRAKSGESSQAQATDNKHFRFQDVKDLLSEEGLRLTSYATKSTDSNDQDAIWVSNDAKAQVASGQIDYSALGVKSGVEFITLNYTGSGTPADLKKVLNLANKLLTATLETKLPTKLEKRILEKSPIAADEEPLGKGWIDLDVIKLGADVNIELHISRSQLN